MDVSIAVVLLGIATVLYYLWAKWSQTYWTRRGVPQLEPNVIFGDLGPWARGKKSSKDMFSEFYELAKSKGYKHLGLYDGKNPEYMLLDLKIIKRILTKDFDHFVSRGFVHHPNIKLSTHLFSMEGQEWRNRRVKLTPVFTSGKMKMMFETVAATATELTNVVGDRAKANESFNIKDTLARFTTDVIASVAFGLEGNSLRDPDDRFREIGRRVFTPSRIRAFKRNFIPKPVRVAFKIQNVSDEVIDYFTGIVKDTINYREKNNVERKDFIQLMIRMKNTGTLNPTANENNGVVQKEKYFVTEEEILNESFLFFLAGFETSSSTMTFTIFELAQNHQIQEKLRGEILRVLEKHDGKITYESLLEMEYLDKVIKETLRKYPVLTVLSRKCTKTYGVPDTDVVIEKGTKVHIPLIGIQNDPEYYPNPEEYNPENFAPENIANRPDFTWMPFGEGPRQCIGMRFGLMQAKLGVVALLSKFKFTLDPSMKPPYEVEPTFMVFNFKKDIMVVAKEI